MHQLKIGRLEGTKIIHILNAVTRELFTGVVPDIVDAKVAFLLNPDVLTNLKALAKFENANFSK